MEKICIFCGRALGRWERKSLYCGNGTQTVCKECYEKYSPMTNVERGLLAWQNPGRSCGNLWSRRKGPERKSRRRRGRTGNRSGPGKHVSAAVGRCWIWDP